VISLAIDTCEGRGSVAVRSGGATVAFKKHADASDYSSWLLPAVSEVLTKAGTKMELVELLGVATGPGSFTGLRVGLTTVKAWAEVYGTPVVGVSRLEAMANATNPAAFVAACYAAQRGQLFGGLYRSVPRGLRRTGEETVISPEGFVKLVAAQAGEEKVTWISLDPGLINDLEALKSRVKKGDSVEICEPELASHIGALAEDFASRGEYSDPLALEANYVRRSDAEIFWKGGPSNAL
jgi:tRNA threonylcarbamoyladenosine biosynthesis protein TsaB